MARVGIAGESDIMAVLVTSVGITTSDGQVVSVTHVIANPTGIWGVNEAVSTHGYDSLSNSSIAIALLT